MNNICISTLSKGSETVTGMNGWWENSKQPNNNKYKETPPHCLERGGESTDREEEREEKNYRADGWVSHLSRWEGTFCNSRATVLTVHNSERGEKKYICLRPEVDFKLRSSGRLIILPLKMTGAEKTAGQSINAHEAGWLDNKFCLMQVINASFWLLNRVHINIKVI